MGGGGGGGGGSGSSSRSVVAIDVAQISLWEKIVTQVPILSSLT
jgi:hypothetical protein